MTWKIYANDAFCFPGCMPEGYGPEECGDTFETRQAAIECAQVMLDGIFGEELAVNGDSLSVNRVHRACKKELESTGETSVELPYRDEETGEVSNTGYRYISFSIEEN